MPPTWLRQQKQTAATFLLLALIVLIGSPAAHAATDPATFATTDPATSVTTDPATSVTTDPATSATSPSESASTPAPELPDSPGAQSAAAATPPAGAGGQTKRILGIIPNFRSVSADTELPPQSPKEKLKTAFQESFDYSAFIFVGIQAGAAMASDNTPAFRQGAAGYARYYWHTFADQADENLWVEGILPSALHQDSRFYTLGHGNPLHRAEYAITRIVITRTDDGGRTFNSSEVFGAGIASGISSTYYPGSDRTWTKVGQRWLTNVLIDGGTFTFKEFWPDINNAVFHTKN